MPENFEPKFENPLMPLPEKLEGEPQKAAAEAEELLEFSAEEKAAVIRDYLGKNYKSLPEEDREKAKLKNDFLLGLSPAELERGFGEMESALVCRVIAERNKLFRQITENGLEEDGLRKFAEEKGWQMLPERIVDTLQRLNINALNLDDFLYRGPSIREEGKKKLADNMIKSLRSELIGLTEENKKWREYSKFDREKEERPIGVRGFEKFDQPHAKGQDILKIALEMLPRGALSTNIESIEYKDEIEPMNQVKYGFSAESAASFYSERESGIEKGRIVFYKTPDSGNPADYLNRLPFILIHEWGHSLDPRIIDQKDLPPGEQFKMVKEWEQVRVKEEEWSSYVKKIENPDKREEEVVKSRESFAESIALLFDNPNAFKELHPQRYEFCSTLLKKRFPEFDEKRLFGAKKWYAISLFGLSRPGNREQLSRL